MRRGLPLVVRLCCRPTADRMWKVSVLKLIDGDRLLHGIFTPFTGLGRI